jgi:rod shape-determining protein MreD
MPTSRLARPLTKRFRKRINRAPSPAIALSLPWLSIMLGSLVPTLPLIASAPIMPPFGLMLLLSWRQLRPGILPVWIGFPLGAFDDIFSGQPFGSATLLWSAIMIALELIEARFPWRNFLLDWLVSTGLLCAYLVAALAIANAAGGAAQLPVLAPQALSAMLLFPVVGRLAAALDRLRLMPLVDVN